MSDIIQVRVTWATIRKCCFCGNVSCVHSCSDGHFRCDSCVEKLVLEGQAEYSQGYPSVSLDHAHSNGRIVSEEEYKDDPRLRYLFPPFILT